ncbi:MAG: RagB/SusD family nutrient uptake outer membrane protein [Tannerellaceae bacterium]|nr:RagB/SusD family nutrient uptake outer membrane protein [Tannerellaceae bacterium]
MKKYILIVAALGFLFSSCSDYLDKLPENKYDVEEIDYSKTENMFQVVSGAYAVIRTSQGFGSWAGFGLIAIRSDDTEKGSTPTDQIEYQYAKDFEYFKIKEFWALDGEWENLYYAVQVCNSALESLNLYKEHINNDNDIKLNAQYQAEVKFLRAYLYFYIARLWGDAPLLMDNSQVVDGIGKTSREEILSAISSDLDECITNFPALRPNEMPYPGQVTRYSAQGLKAKIQADLGDWDAVLTATEDIINSGKFELYNDYYEYFKKPGKLCNENLFELQYTDFNSSTGEVVESDSWFTFQGPRSEIIGVKPISSGWGFMIPSTSIIKLFTDRGETIRYTTTFLFTGEYTPSGDYLVSADTGDPTVYNGKAYLPSVQLTDGRSDYGVGNNIRMLRYADILLLNAEAKVRKGQNGDTPFNLVRDRADMPHLNNVTLEQILEERQVEFACEWGERYFDLLRTDRAASVLPGFVKGESEFYPVPQSQIDMNPLLRD